jgi:hypothetical protein
VESLQRQRLVRPLGRGAVLLTSLAGALLVTFVGGCGGSTPPPATSTSTSTTTTPTTSTPTTSTTPTSARGRPAKLVSCGAKNAPGAEPTELSGLFSPNSVWNRPDVGSQPLGDPRLAQEFTQEAESELKQQIGPWIQTNTSSTPVYVVGPEQRCVPVRLDVTQAYGRTLSRAFARVPLPYNARPAAGSDEHLTVIQPSTNSMWEFWRMRREGDQWHAAWGGAMHDVSANPGYYTAGSWPGARSYWGSTATSLPVVAGTMTVGELERGQINHALAVSLPNARKGVFAFPAQRTDGTLTSSVAIPEGAMFRLDPKLDLKSLHLPRVVDIMAQAAQRYGIIVRDKTLHAIGFYAEDPTPLGANPYTRLFDGRSPSELMASFPWKYLQAVKMKLKTGSA